jgi:hypothetical protein
MERLTESDWKERYDIKQLHPKFIKLAEYEDTELTPQNIICQEDIIKVLKTQNKLLRGGIKSLREENIKLYNQLMETEKSCRGNVEG